MWLDLLKQAPQVGVICFIVVVFLKHMDKRDQDHIAERQATRASLDANTSAMQRNTEGMMQLVQVIRNGNGR